ncbi:hypothetical protein GCM10007160_05200 [Litchfieldella qijiaojingensis]|uniref:Type VI secretion system tip protein VgrG n=1 Tax=Litchfieldella qijiaojingensis TaxID=980347 RepID=A0ABQ2YEY1_9GAMM|nr:type VI secretion system tip protein TssI/VgrG [Halomonas qijiaojingensis]GGX80940.1 hypothetical protein GCM10007160_05200 [Halomonas qijiaojingensis]
MANQTGLQFTLALAGRDALDLAVTQFTLSEALSQPFTLEVHFASRDDTLIADDWLDRNATLTVWRDGEVERRVSGTVSHFARGDSGYRRTHYDIVIRPALWRLGLRHNSRIFEQAAPLGVVQTLCEEHGLRDLVFAIKRKPEPREFLVQYRENDLAFLQRLLAEEGIFFSFDDDGRQLVFADDVQMLRRLPEQTYHARAGGVRPERCYLHSLRQVSSVATSSVVLKDYSFKTPAYAQQHQAWADDPNVDPTLVHYDYPGRYKRDASGKPFTRVRLEALRREACLAHAESDLIVLAPGTRFRLTEHDVAETNRDWQVVEVEHTGTQPQAVEEDAVGAEGVTHLENTLVLMPGDRAWRPAPPERPRVDGPQTAIVVGPEGEEIHTDEYGRVRVLFPWNRDGTASAWLRVSQGCASARAGPAPATA